MSRRRRKTNSRVPNSKRFFLEHLDGRSAPVRRYRDLLALFRKDLTAPPTTATEQLLRTAAALAVHQEILQTDLAAGRPVKPLSLARVAGALGRTLRRLGLTGTLSGKKGPTPPPADVILEYLPDV